MIKIEAIFECLDGEKEKRVMKVDNMKEARNWAKWEAKCSGKKLFSIKKLEGD